MNACETKGRHGVINAGKTLWSMSERSMCVLDMALYKTSYILSHLCAVLRDRCFTVCLSMRFVNGLTINEYYYYYYYYRLYYCNFVYILRRLFLSFVLLKVETSNVVSVSWSFIKFCGHWAILRTSGPRHFKTSLPTNHSEFGVSSGDGAVTGCFEIKVRSEAATSLW